MCQSSRDLITAKHEILTYNAIDVQAKLRPTEDDVAALGPDFKTAWNENFKDIPDKPLMILSPVATFPGDPSPFGPIQFFSLVAFTLYRYPFSRGHLHIIGSNVGDAVDFDPGLLSDSKDLDVEPHIWICPPHGLCQGAAPGSQPTFPPNSKAHSDSPNIEYSADDDKILEKWIRENIDSSLSVYCVQGLKVADLSISPHNVGANTRNTAMNIAEKAADIIIQELGLCKY
ncbi:hypothetical protein F5Y10DRAFT_278654 [Nemania abortiva]|nr:hypothetical protein F5Y10DRAFT_278654 [Nemania abortiva]